MVPFTTVYPRLPCLVVSLIGIKAWYCCVCGMWVVYLLGIKLNNMKRIIETPEILHALFEEYKKHVEDNPFIVVDYVGKDAVPVERKKQRPITFEGFQVFVSKRLNMWGIYDYFNNKDNYYNDFSLVCSRIREEIRDHQIGGGMAGVYNPSITQRLNGLVDKQEVKTIKEQPLFGDEPEEAQNDYDDLI